MLVMVTLLRSRDRRVTNGMPVNVIHERNRNGRRAAGTES
jgi:hypothetical protein